MILRLATLQELDIAIDIIDAAKQHLKEQGINQWQDGYPDAKCIESDIVNCKGYFVVDELNDNIILGYLCIDFDGEPAYNNLLNGNWNNNDKYVVVHRLALSESARGKNIASRVFNLVEEISRAKGVNYFRIDTDEDNKKMLHILGRYGFKYVGVINFDNSEKVAFEKTF